MKAPAAIAALLVLTVRAFALDGDNRPKPAFDAVIAEAKKTPE